MGISKQSMRDAFEHIHTKDDDDDDDDGNNDNDESERKTCIKSKWLAVQ